MDSGPTLDVIDGFCDEEDEDGDEIDGGEREVWGRLFPLIDAYSKTGKDQQLRLLNFIMLLLYYLLVFCPYIFDCG